jgi:hypothetical protein
MTTGTLIESAADVSHVAPDEPHNDLRHAMMTLPVEHQNAMLAEYRVRRDNFRRWLMQQLEEGKHYGVPPGCEPKGNPNPRQWQAQPSLYAAGADLLCDLLTLRAEFKADLEAWQQLGSKPGYVVMVCRLYSRANNTLIGEGRGARKEGQKGGDLNNAIKMAQKSAKVDAVLNCYGLRDMFTQDLENLPEPHDNPTPDERAPQAPPRAQRTDPKAAAVVEAVKRISAKWKQANPNVWGSDTEWAVEYKKWVMRICDRTFNPVRPEQWTEADLASCERELGIRNEDR